MYKKNTKVYKPKLLESIDDESFLYDELVKGPVNYVRCDDSYINYLKAKEPKDLPGHPNQSEKQFYAYEYDLKKNIHKELVAIDELLARIRRKIEKYEKKVEKLIAAREIEEAKILQEYLDELRKQEQDILDRKRAEIIAAAKLDFDKYKDTPKPTKKEEIPVKTEQKEEILPEIEEEEPVQEEIDENLPVYFEVTEEMLKDGEFFINQPATQTEAKYILNIGRGYYVSEGKTSILKKDAYVFKDKESAEKMKAKLGGRVTKL